MYVFKNNNNNFSSLDLKNDIVKIKNEIDSFVKENNHNKLSSAPEKKSRSNIKSKEQIIKPIKEENMKALLLLFL